MKNIIVPTDFSKNDMNALNYAVSLFEEDRCTFYLLNAFQPNEITAHTLLHPELGEKTYDQTKTGSETGLKKRMDKPVMTTDNPNHDFKMISSYDTLRGAIAQTLENNDISIVVIGTRGEINSKNILFGSKALNIIYKIKNCQFLLVPPNSVFQKNTKKELVYATNFHTPFQFKDLDSIISIAKNIKAVVRVLHILENGELTADQENNKEALREYLKGVASAFHTLTNENADTGVQTFIERRESDLLALTREKQNFFSTIFPGTMIEDAFGYKPQIPILLMYN